MDTDELSNYRFQLAQVEASLAKDPGNEQLRKLHADLGDLIALSEQVVGASAASQGASAGASATAGANHGTAAATSTTTAVAPAFHVGDVVEAKYSGDGRYYEARIEGLSADGTSYSVQFLGYGNTEFVVRDSVRAGREDGKRRQLTTSAASGATTATSAAASSSSSSTTLTAGATSAATTRDAKKKRGRTLEEQHARKDAEFAKKQSSWTSFTTKSAAKKRSLVKPGTGLTASVGASASGGGVRTTAVSAGATTSRAVSGAVPTMTQFQQRGRHVFKNVAEQPEED